MKLVTWNVNSLRVRLPRVLEFLDEHAPDVICMQETNPRRPRSRCPNWPKRLPRRARLGRAGAARRELALTDPVAGLPGELRDDEARWIEATVGGLRAASVYVPNGRTVGSPTYDEKLAFPDALAVRDGAAVARDAARHRG